MSRRNSWTEKKLQLAEDMLEKTPFVFVYGTLKQGYGNNRLLHEAEFIGADTTSEDWLLGDAGCPYAFPPDVVPKEFKELLHPIRGEVYRVQDKHTACSLDSLEGYTGDKDHSHYFRRVIETKIFKVDAWIYTSEHFGRAYHCDAPNLTDQGEWQWSRN